MRSVIEQNSPAGIAAVVKQQFEYGAQIDAGGLMPILEPEVSIKTPDKAGAEKTLRDEIIKGLDALPADKQVMLKLTIPDVADFYKPLIDHPRVLRVVALSGGYTRTEACKLLEKNHGMIASFSRALINDLKKQLSDSEFNAKLSEAIDEIYDASAVKV
jgi:fructose-bisphosphate aldolase class I